VSADFAQLPPDLPVPVDDGAAAHLPGSTLPAIRLPTTAGDTVAVDEFGAGRSVVYVYPLTGRPGVDLPDDWDRIPGARGCTAEACDFRDHHEDLLGAGAVRVFGLSTQSIDYQRELVDRLRLPYPILSDERLLLADDPGLPTFRAQGMTLYRRLTMIVSDGAVEHVFYPVFPPNRHAAEVIDWLRRH
jgi:peroxiredoxin